MLRRFLWLLLLVFLALSGEPANAQDLSPGDFTPSSNCWAILIYASSSNQNSSSFQRFQDLTATLREQSGSPSQVVAFSPFETSATRRPSPDVLRELLVWFRDAATPNATLDLPAMRADARRPVELRFVLCGETRGAALLLPGSTSTVKIDDFVAAVRDVDSPCERALFFFNLVGETTTRGAATAVRVEPATLNGDVVNDAWEESAPERSAFPQSYFRTVFFNQDDAAFFESLTNAFQGAADVLNADGVVTALETLEYVRDVAAKTPSFQRLGQDFPLTKSRKPQAARPTELFARLGVALASKGQKELTTEALRRAFRDFQPDDYAKTAFYGARPPLDALVDGRFTAEPYSNPYYTLVYTNDAPQPYYLVTDSFKQVAKSVEQRKAEAQ